MTHDDGWSIVGILAVLAILVIFGPALCFLFGWIGGWFAKITIGNILCNGLNALVGTTMFTPSQLPLIGGTLAWIGGFFKGISSSAKRS